MSTEERRRVACECEQALRHGIHTYVDEMDDAVNKAYAAVATHLYPIGPDGKWWSFCGNGGYHHFFPELS